MEIGSAAEFLDLTPEEEAYVELKLHLADALEAKRKAKGLTQKALAARMKSSPSRVAFIKKGAPSVSIDLLVRGLFALGITRKELAKAVGIRHCLSPHSPGRGTPEKEHWAWRW